MSRCVQIGAVLCVIAVVSAACGGQSQQGENVPAGAAPAGAPAVTAAPPPLPGASTVTGLIKFEGTAPIARVIRMTSDPLCMPEGGATSEVILVGAANGLQNVFVYVKEGLGARTFPAPATPVVLDQKGCTYMPHVFGVQVGQPVQILNSDPTLHNVHALPKANVEFNFSQPLKGLQSERAFDKTEVMVPFRCDVHGWMAAYGGVLAHPFFAVSKPDGSFEIKGLPAGTYTIEAWHERLGVKTQTVTVDGTASATVGFAFTAET